MKRGPGQEAGVEGVPKCIVVMRLQMRITVKLHEGRWVVLQQGGGGGGGGGGGSGRGGGANGGTPEISPDHYTRNQRALHPTWARHPGTCRLPGIS